MGITLLDLVRRFDAGEIRLPLMQRDYVWRPAKVVKLLDSLYHQWPIGCFYVWHTQHDRPTKKRFGGEAVSLRPLDGFYGFLLDGQQRLTSLSLAIEAEAEHNLATRAFFDLDRERFYLGSSSRTVSKRIEGGDPTLVALSELHPRQNGQELQGAIQRIVEDLRERGMLQASRGAEVDYRRRLDAVASMLHADALCETFRDDHVGNAIELFARLNKGGTSLSAGDVEAARLAQEATDHILGPMRDFVQEPNLRALGLNFVFATRALVTTHRGTSSFSKLPRNWASAEGDIGESWERTAQGLRYAVDLVRQDLGWAARRWLPSANALIPVAYLFREKGRVPSRAERESIRRYLLLTGLRGMFRGSVETTINMFVNPLRKARGNTKNQAALLVRRIPQNRLYRIKPDEIRAATGMYSPLMQIYLAYLVSRGARSWPSGRPIARVALGDIPNDPLAVHHIIPKKFMQQFDVPPEKLNTMANYAIVAQSDNAELADSDPAATYKALSPGQREMAAEQLFFRASDELLNPHAYEEFLAHRSKHLAERLNQFLGF